MLPLDPAPPRSAPAHVGMRLQDVDTPALIVDLDAFERNLAHMAQVAQQAKIRLRAHAKTHKSPIIALKQIAFGAVGVCCQKVSEAEAMVAGGVRDILVSNEIVGRQKLERLAQLAGHARIAVCVDDADNVQELSAAAQRHATVLEVLVEIDVGAHRCGVRSGEAAVRLARLVVSSPGLSFAGLQAYHGPAQHIREFEGRQQASEDAISNCRQTRDMLLQEGLECRIISGAGTGTYQFEAASGVYNELQAGSYIFMDADYARNRRSDGSVFNDFEHSVFVLTTVMSRPTTKIAVVDAGLKALSVDAGMPLVCDVDGAEYVRASDEHGTLWIRGSAHGVQLGDKLRLIPGNCDPTINLHDWYVGIRNDQVEVLWPIAARGPGY